MKRYLAVILMLLCCCPGLKSQQTEITGKDKEALVAEIDKAYRNVNTLSASFTQEKSSSLLAEKVVQKGTLHYKTPAKMRWAYTSPETITIVFSDGKTVIQSKNGASVSNKMAGEMGSMIVNAVNGQFLKDNTSFSSSYYRQAGNGNVTVKLKPLNKKMKLYYKDITLVLDKHDYLARKIVLAESSGDVTTIVFSDKHVNAQIPDSLFKQKP